MQEAIVRQSDDQTVSTLEHGPRHEDGSQLCPCGPHQPYVSIDEQEVAERAKNGHKAGRLENHAVLRLRHDPLLFPLVVLENICAHRLQVVRHQTRRRVVEPSLIPDLTFVSDHEDCLLSGDDYLVSVGILVEV